MFSPQPQTTSPGSHSAPQSPTDEKGLDEASRAALKHLGLAVGTVICLSLCTYLVPGLQRLKPWTSGEAVPLAGMVQRMGTESLPTFAGAGGSFRAGDESLAESLGATVAQNLGGTPPKHTSSQPSATPVSAADTTKGEQEGEAAGTPTVVVDPAEYAGIETELENGQALESFYEALRQTAVGESGAITRIAHYGDSSIATDLITHTVRRQMQQRFGDAGHGFILPARGTMPYLHRDVRHQYSDDWELKQLVAREDSSGRYGYGGVQFRGLPGAFSRVATVDEGPVGTHVSKFVIFYQQHKRGGKFRYRVDGGDWKMIDTRGSDKDKFIEIDLPDGEHELYLRVFRGQVRLYGIALERDQTGVVYDSLGMVGARARRLLNFDAKHIDNQLRKRDVDLLMLAFGGNEADDQLREVEAYEAEYREVIKHMRLTADQPCLIVAPLDQAERDTRGNVTTLPQVPVIVEAQKRAARAEGCAFYNTFEAMGGEGAMYRWSRSKPRLALSDYRHATPSGYEVIGNMLYKALLKGFAQHVKTKP